MIIIYKADSADLDRWISFDRFPRKLFRMMKGKKTGFTGQSKALGNTCLGLQKIGIDYKLNPGKAQIESAKTPVLLFGQSNVAEYITQFPKTDFIVGPALYSHPIESPRLAEFENVKKILVPGPWMQNMCESYWGDKVIAWPVGIDTDTWLPEKGHHKQVDFLIYNKIMWGDENNMLQKIKTLLDNKALTYTIINYGSYQESEYKDYLAQCRGMIYLCEHETQGIAYQQALSKGVPILAWDRNDYWLDPRFYPNRVKYKPVSSVPYWDERCGCKFESMEDFSSALDWFLKGLERNKYDSRSYILENLSLEQCTQSLLDIFSNDCNSATTQGMYSTSRI